LHAKNNARSRFMKARFVSLSLLAAAAGSFPLHAEQPADFVEERQPFIRSALVITGDPSNNVRRGVLLRLGENVWTCFDPDLLRYAAVWKTPPKQPPLSFDSMAAISYPDKQAKADKPPALRGTLLSTTPELPGAGVSDLPTTDPRKGVLTDGKTKLGPLPADSFRWQGVLLSGEQVVLSYRVGDRQIRETNRAFTPDLIERIIAVGPGKETIAIHLNAPSGNGGLLHLLVRGKGESTTLSDPERGDTLRLPPSEKTASFQILRSPSPITHPPRPTPIPEAAAEPLFPGKMDTASPTAKKSPTPIATRPINLPYPNPWRRAVRPTDIAFLSNGDALITTLDGDVWRVADIEKTSATWTRAAFGIFEPMSITTNDDDEVFVLGRDQITRLEDTDGDGFFDKLHCASDAFLQTLHTRDYATSLELLPDGSFVIGRAGLMDAQEQVFNENTADRGSILRISPDGTMATLLADGLRVPYIGVRPDGAVFASDQQGHFIPSTPLHLVAGGVPYLGYEPSDHRNRKTPAAPLLWFPYQINRSASSFASLPGRAFPSLGNRFAHLSWSGRVFIVETPADGQPFTWKLPADFDFPILGAATQPTTGKFFATGIGISGYKPTTPREIGLAEISEAHPVATPVSLDVGRDRISVSFREPLPPGLSLIAPRPRLDLWDVRRTNKYGSGHYRWDGAPGEHSVTPGEPEVSADRKTISFAVPALFRADILRLTLHFSDTVTGRPPYSLELYARPGHLAPPAPADLAAVAEREKSAAPPVVAGDASRGGLLFKNYGCAGCHSLDSTRLTGPPLNGIGSREKDGLDAFLRTSILDPAAEIAEGYEASMPSFAGVIPGQDIEHLVAYLKSLR